MDRRAGSGTGANGERAESLILADTSAWIEYLRGTGSPEAIAIRNRWPDRIAITQPVLMELLAGTLTEQRAAALEGMLAPVRVLAVDPRVDFVIAAKIYRAVRRAGHTMRNQVDCLVAAVATRNGAYLLHRDADFEHIAEQGWAEVYQPAT